MAANFTSLLERPMDEIQRPKPLPAGTYRGKVGTHRYDESSNKRTPFAEYTLHITEACEDVDAEALAEVDLSRKTVSKRYYMTDDALYRLKDFLASVGVETTGRALGACIPEANGAVVLIAITQRQSEDGKDIFNDTGEVKGID